MTGKVYKILYNIMYSLKHDQCLGMSRFSRIPISPQDSLKVLPLPWGQFMGTVGSSHHQKCFMLWGTNQCIPEIDFRFVQHYFSC